MAINLAHRPDLDSRVERLADRLGLKGRGRKTATIERAPTLLKKHVAQDRAAIAAALDHYIAEEPRLRERLAGRNGGGPPLWLQQALYDERGLPG